MDETQPDTTPEVDAGAPAQSTDDVHGAASQPTETAQQSTPSNDDTVEWLSKKGFDPGDPDFATKIAKSYREAEKLALSKAQEASELKRSLSSSTVPPAQQGQADPVMHEFIQDYKRDKLINNFKNEHEDWAQVEPIMADILTQETPNGYTYSQLVNAGFMSLESVYAMAKGAAPSNIDDIKTQTKQEVLQTLANQQRAGGGNPNANNPSPQTPNSDPIMEAIKRGRAS